MPGLSGNARTITLSGRFRQWQCEVTPQFSQQRRKNSLIREPNLFEILVYVVGNLVPSLLGRFFISANGTARASGNGFTDRLQHTGLPNAARGTIR